MVIKSVFLTKNYQILVILGNVDVSVRKSVAKFQFIECYLMLFYTLYHYELKM